MQRECPENNRETITKEITAGLTAAISGILDGMLSAMLAGVNPVYSLYNLMMGTPIAGIFIRSVYMAVINASAMALVAYASLAPYSVEEQVCRLKICRKASNWWGVMRLLSPGFDNPG